VLGNTTRIDEESAGISRFEELADKASPAQNEEVFEDLDSQQIPKQLEVHEYDPAYLDYFGQLHRKPGSDTFLLSGWTSISRCAKSLQHQPDLSPLWKL
jgi:hypothetical protein